ncbi:MAG: murein biosynthesis integral membrane protein MurJ [Armatimonadota bacterium]
MEGKPRASIAAGAAIIFAGTLTSRVIGLVRENLLNNTFHDRLVKDAFGSAFLVPDTLYYLLAGGALSAAFIPVLTGYLQKGQREEANRVTGAIITLLLLAMAAGLLFIFIFAPGVVRLVAYEYTPGTPKFNLTVILAREMSAMIIFTVLSGLLTGLLQSVHHFLATVVVWNTYSLGIILGISVFSKLPVPSWAPGWLHWTGPTLGIHGAALGVLLGALSLVAIQLPVVLRHGFRLSPVWDLRHEGVLEVLRRFAPVTVGLAISQVNLFAAPQSLATEVGDGGVMVIRNATRLVLLPLGLFGLAITNAAFPRLSQQANQGERAAYIRVVNGSLRMLLLLVLPAAVAMLVLSEPLMALIVGGEGAGITDVRAAAFTQAFFTLGIFTISLLQFANRAFYALQDTRTPVIVQVVTAAANIGLTIILIRYTPLSYGGVALAASLTLTAGTLVLLEMLRRRLGGLGGRRILISGGKILLATFALGVVTYVTARALAPQALAGGQPVSLAPALLWPAPDLAHPVPGGLLALPGGQPLWLSLLIQLVLSSLAGLLVYAGLLWAMRSEELFSLLRRLGGRFRRGQAEL